MATVISEFGTSASAVPTRASVRFRNLDAVSFEPSLHSLFGTGVVMGETGIVFNCRGDYYLFTFVL